MKYRVEIGYMEFLFSDRAEALDFAEMAALHGTEDRCIEVQLLKEEGDVEM